MMELKELATGIWRELRNADYYAHEAVKHKDAAPDLASVYARLASDKVGHAEMLNKQAVEMVEKCKRNGKPNAEIYQKAWDWEHERMVDEISDIRRLMDIYKG